MLGNNEGDLASLACSGWTNLSMSELSEEELNEYREIFSLVDKDGGGSISNEEVGDLMDTLGICATQEEIDLMINEIDQDSNGEVDFEEFVAVMSRKVNAKYTSEQVQNAFRVFEDKKSPGVIMPRALEQLLNEYCSDSITPEQVTELIKQLELDANGTFRFNDYIKMMMS